ncbi:MAG: thiamine phosphate synthase [Candidatus Omnitrophota bacterium]
MKSRKSLLKKSLTYLILDKPTLGNCSLKKIYAALRGGQVGLIQLRDKQSSGLKFLNFANKVIKGFKTSKTLFIINDDLAVALATNADGLHLGQDDLPLRLARKILGKDKIIGVSCHNLSQALKAQNEGADYIGVGPIFSTSTKPETRPIGLKVLKAIKNKIKIPCFAIGNIHLGNLKQIMATGTRRVAVCRAIIKAKDLNVAIKQFNKNLNL